MFRQYAHHHPSLSAALISIVLTCCVSSCALHAAKQSAHELVPMPRTLTDIEKENERKIAAAPAAQFSAGDFNATNGVKIMYRLLAPGTSKHEKLPLVVMMHGSGQIGTDNQKQLGWLARSWAHPDIQPRFPAYVLVPQVPARSADYQPAADEGMQMSFARPPLEAVMQLVEHTIKNNDVDASRVYIVGFSMGASGAWNALALRPDIFAAALPIAGVAPDRQLANVIAQTPVMIVHGNADNDNPIASDRAIFAALRALPDPRAQFKEYDGLDHNVPADMVFATAWREWLFTQRRKVR
jgi:predicted peptidase